MNLELIKKSRQTIFYSQLLLLYIIKLLRTELSLQFGDITLFWEIKYFTYLMIYSRKVLNVYLEMDKGLYNGLGIFAYQFTECANLICQEQDTICCSSM